MEVGQENWTEWKELKSAKTIKESYFLNEKGPVGGMRGSPRTLCPKDNGKVKMKTVLQLVTICLASTSPLHNAFLTVAVYLAKTRQQSEKPGDTTSTFIQK